MEKDPVCGMDLDPAEAAGTTLHEGTMYYFCSTSCKEAFDAAPSTYLQQQAGDAARDAKPS